MISLISIVAGLGLVFLALGRLSDYTTRNESADVQMGSMIPYGIGLLLMALAVLVLVGWAFVKALMS